MEKRRFALIGTGNRGTTMWGKDLLAGWREHVDLTAIVEKNSLRGERARNMIGSNAPLYENIDSMLAEQKPDLVIVCTPDHTHDDIVVRALESGIDVITEKPMTTSVEKIRRILDAEKRTGRRVDVSFNYRYAPTVACQLRRQGNDGSCPCITAGKRSACPRNAIFVIAEESIGATLDLLCLSKDASTCCQCLLLGMVLLSVSNSGWQSNQVHLGARL